MAARYNAYFYARENMRIIEDAIAQNHKNNFNKVLHVFYDVDSSVINGMNTQLDDCIKKASIAIQRHENSNWVDNSYILIGKSRYYQGDFVNAIETFKYVNTKSEDDNARHEALVYLMRTFLDYNEENNAIAVSDYLKKEKLSRNNLKLLTLTRAYMYERREDYKNMVEQLAYAAPIMNTSENVARINYIIAQIYQLKGFDAEAYNNYSLCLKSNPSYELSFYAKLNMAQVTQLSKENDLKKIRKFFQKLLRDPKNLEFQDKIYYEMGNFELKQDNLNEAIAHYQSSIKASMNNPRQKGYSYLSLGKLYYENFKEYETAKSYYDSVVSVLPKDDEQYEAISQRQEILADFVEQINTIQLQDSLIYLANLDTASLYAILDGVIEQERIEAENAEKERKKAERRMVSNQSGFSNSFGQTGFSTESGGATWYFYNNQAVSMGTTEFRRIWGDRKLEDNWRRARKESTGLYVEETEESEVIETLEVSKPEEKSLTNEDKRSKYLSGIPFSEEQKVEALAMVEQALYRLGNIYNFQLDEKENATETFETLLSRFPDTISEAEVLYLLYLIYKEQEDDRFKIHAKTLQNKFPNTTYSKLISNPNYREESTVASEKLKSYYKEAFFLYSIDSLEQALDIVQEGMKLFPDNSFSDNMKILEILVIGKLEGMYKYQYELQIFPDNYPESELLEYVESLLKASEDFKLSEATKEAIQYIQYFEQVHFLVLVYPAIEDLSELLPNLVDEFNEQYFQDYDLNTGNLTLDDEHSMILVNEFGDREESLAYFKSFIENSPLKSYPAYNFYNFVISKDNFQIFYQTKGLDDYMDFFKKNYL